MDAGSSSVHGATKICFYTFSLVKCVEKKTKSRFLRETCSLGGISPGLAGLACPGPAQVGVFLTHLSVKKTPNCTGPGQARPARPGQMPPRLHVSSRNRRIGIFSTPFLGFTLAIVLAGSSHAGAGCSWLPGPGAGSVGGPAGWTLAWPCCLVIG